MRIITIERSAIERIKSYWPVHYIPGDADLIVAAFATNGDLVHYEISDDADKVIVENQDAGEALSALFDDAKKHAVNLQPRADIMDHWIYR